MSTTTRSCRAPSASLQRRPDGRQFVRLTSDRGVQEPFVDVILEISWATGRLVREYTLLFDPPATAPRRAAPGARAHGAGTGVTAPIVAAAPPPAPSAPRRRAAAAARRARRASPRAAARAPRAERDPRAEPRAKPRLSVRSPGVGRRARRCRATSTAFGPATRCRGSPRSTQRPGVSLDQMLVALFRANPQAFIGNNMNRLKAGVGARGADGRAAAGDRPAEARQVITAQSADFGAYRQRLAGRAGRRARRAARQAGGKVQASVDDRKQAAAPTPDQLTLSKGGVGRQAAAAPKTPVQGARARRPPTRAWPNSQERRRAEEAAGRRVAPCRRDGGRGTGAARRSAAATAPPPPPCAHRHRLRHRHRPLQPPPAAAPARRRASARRRRRRRPPPAAPRPAAAAAARRCQRVAPTPRRAAPRQRRRRRAKPRAARRPRRPEPELARLADGRQPARPSASARSLLALLAGFGIYRFTQRSKKDSGETSFLESRLQPDSFFGASGGQRIDTRDAGGSSSSMTYSLSQLDAIGDVDPVAEADVYLAYGRDLQAEEILKEAMRSSPERLAIRTKLLEVYAKRRDTKGFELLATQLYRADARRGRGLGQGAGNGRRRSIPDNPLYQPGGAPRAVAATAARSPSRSAPARMPQSVMPVPSQFGQSLRRRCDPTRQRLGSIDLDLDNPDVGTPTTAPVALDERAEPGAPPSAPADGPLQDFDQRSTPQDAAGRRNDAGVRARSARRAVAFDLSRHLARPRQAGRRPPADDASRLPRRPAWNCRRSTRTVKIRWRASSSWPRSSARSATRTARATCCAKCWPTATRRDAKTKAQGMLDDLGSADARPVARQGIGSPVRRRESTAVRR